MVTKIGFYSKNKDSQESGAYPIPASLCPLQTSIKSHKKYLGKINFRLRIFMGHACLHIREEMIKTCKAHYPGANE